MTESSRDNFMLVVSAIGLFIGGLGAGYCIRDTMAASAAGRCRCFDGQAPDPYRAPVRPSPYYPGQTGALSPATKGR